MASPRPSIEPSSEYDEFIENLRKFHEERGTHFEAAPKISNHRVDLLRLYNRITGEGGYDVVSDKVKNKLAWRVIGEEFGLGDANVAALAFTLKTVYYKNVVAYEIKHFHKKEPPPKEILEDETARGGGVLTRTLENYKKRNTRDENALANGFDGASEDGGTPKEGDEPPSTGRAGRGLRSAPPQRQLFQSDMSTPRVPRAGLGQHDSPAPAPQQASTSSGIAHNSSVPSALAAYEPKNSFPMSLRTVSTPGNNFDAYKAEQKRTYEAALARRYKKFVTPRGVVMPGFNTQGLNIYARCLLSLQSGVLEEQEYALHHLVKISYERGDKYEFRGFTGLAEALMDKILDISELLTDVKLTVSYKQNEDIKVVAKKNTSEPIAEQFNASSISKKRKYSDMLETDNFARRLLMVNEAGLVLRNMVLLEANADFLARKPSSRQLLEMLLTLPKTPQIVELQHYALEIAEQLTSYYVPRDSESLFAAMMTFVDSSDRGLILTSIRAICRLGSHFDMSPNLQDVPVSTIQKLCDYLLVEDEELRTAALDFLYQFTAVPDGVERLLQKCDTDALIKQLSRLLMHGSRVDDQRTARAPLQSHASLQPEQSSAIEEDPPIPSIPHELVEQLLTYQEPERSSQWLKACFWTEPTGEITQIALWQAYQMPFAPYNRTHPLLPAKDFITNVSATFTTANAQVIGQPPNNKFVIKGLRPRKIPVDPKGRPYLRCPWHVNVPKNPEGDNTAGPQSTVPNGMATPNSTGQSNTPIGTSNNAEASKTNGDVNMLEMPTETVEVECGQFALWPRTLWEHIVSEHLGVKKTEEGKWDLENAAKTGLSCRWADCKRFSHADGTIHNGVSKQGKTSNAYGSAWQVGMHIKTHLPDSSERAYHRSKHNHGPNSNPAQVVNGTAGLSHSGSLSHPPPSAHSNLATPITPYAQSNLQNNSNHRPSTSSSLNPFPAGAGFPDTSWTTLSTPLDEKHEPTGLPLTAILVLRNLARNIPRTATAERWTRESDGELGASALLEKCFGGIREMLAFVLAYNYSLAAYISDLMVMWERPVRRRTGDEDED